MILTELLLLLCLSVTVSTGTSCPCIQGKYFEINSFSLLSQYIYIYIDIANKGPGQYLTINAKCINNSFAQVSWEKDPSSTIEIRLVSIQYNCHNTSLNKLVS